MNRIKFALVIIGMLLLTFQAESQARAELIADFNKPAENLLTGGQPSQEQLALLKQAGVTKVINLRGPNETVAFDEKAAVEALGLEYISLPIAGAPDVTVEHARALYQLLQGDEKVLVHCASGNRVGALLAIGAHEINGKSVTEALEFGRAAGLRSLEPKVQAVLSGQTQ